ncbi:MAG TPA: hypothetical protein VE175_08795 [Woeseiaceae bacterium]|jgi:hypothetical protein|nr:hypothetical protein [Woeseiaceae bacterium]
MASMMLSGGLARSTVGGVALMAHQALLGIKPDFMLFASFFAGFIFPIRVVEAEKDRH